MNPCDTCNASHKNTVERIIRCGTCKDQPGGMPTKYKASHGIKGGCMKTQHCDQCKHATMRALPKPVLICAMLHKPKFYAPVYWLKDTWGWKRKCEDFIKKENT